MPRRRTLSGATLERLLALPTDEAEMIRHYTLGPEDRVLIRRCRRDHNRFGFALQLCALRYPGRAVRPGETVPLPVVRFLCEQLDIDPGAVAGYARRAPTRYEHLDTLRDTFGIRPFSRPHFDEMSAWLLPVALATTDPAAVAAALMAELRRRGLAAPARGTLARLVDIAMLEADREVARRLVAGLPSTTLARLDTLLDIAPGRSVSALAWTRDVTETASTRNFVGLIERLEMLRAIDIDASRLEGIHHGRIARLTQEGMRLTAQHLRTLSPQRRRALLVVAVLEARTRLTDATVATFDRLIGRLFRRAERRSAAQLQQDAKALNDKVRLLGDLGEALIEAHVAGADAFAAVAGVLPWADLATAVAEARALVRPDGPDHARIAKDNHALVRRIGPVFLAAFRFRAVPAAAPVLQATERLARFYVGDRRRLPTDMPRGFVPRRWRGAVVKEGTIDAPAYELCLLAELRDRLRAGDVWVEGSRQYRAVEDQLLPRALFGVMKTTGPLPLAVPEDGAIWLEARREHLEARLAAVEAKAAADALEGVSLDGDTLRIAALDAAVPPEADRLSERLYARLPRVRITDLLESVAHWTGAAGAFTHLRTGEAAADPRVVLTAALADATNLGLTRMAEACAVASYKQLVWTAGWHIREATYAAALDRVVAAQEAEPLATLFGPGLASSSDGQHFPLAGRGEVVGAINPHKGATPAVSFYTHLSDRYAPFHVRTISVAESEAAHVVDGLLQHGGAVAPVVHHVDGGGVSDHVFGLLTLLGFRFAPRIPNLRDRRLHTFGPAASWPTLGPLVAGRLNTALILDHWDELLRLAVSVRTGAVSAAVALKRLGAYPRQNGLALALRELGRLERTLFTLDWLEDPALRRQATVELNKGEARNALARAVCFHRLGRVRDRSQESLHNRASGLAFVTAAIVLWNTVHLERAISELRAEGEAAPGELLGYLSPLGWQHINLSGDYIWANQAPAPDTRPLETPRAA